MSNLDTLISNIKKELYDEPCVKEYFYYKNLVENNDELKRLDEEIKYHQKMMCKNRENNDVYLSEKAKYDALKKEFDSNPILINYQIAKDEVFSLLVDIKQVLS